MEEKIKNTQKKREGFIIMVLSIFAILSVISVIIVHNKMLKNAQIMGSEIAKSFSTKENTNIYNSELLLNNASLILENQLSYNPSEEDIWRWIEEYVIYLKENLHSKNINMYASINKKLVAAGVWDGVDRFITEDAVWYKNALEANGNVAYTDSYTDSKTQLPVITISKKVQNVPCVVLGIDLYPEYFNSWADINTLPDGSAFFLCDTQGTLIHYDSGGKEIKDVQSYVNKLAKKIKNGTFKSATSYIYDQKNVKQSVYYNIADNGWLTIITIPQNQLLDGLNLLISIYAIICISFLIITMVMHLREYKLNKKFEMTNETLQVLGNLYYAIYRINFKTETYNMIKGSDMVKSHLKEFDKYSTLLNKLGEIIEKSAYKEFTESFSINGIKSLVEKNITDYGGDFLRLFNGEYRWVNVQFLYDKDVCPDEVIICFRDVDEEKQKQLQHINLLEESLESQQKNTEEKNLFFSNISHDMRTPLNAIIGMSELAKGNTTNPSKVEYYINKINSSSKHLLELINNILEVSTLEYGKTKIESKPFYIKESIDEVLDMFKIQATRENKTLNLSYDIKNDFVSGDFFRIKQILNNILSNAFKFTNTNDTISVSVTQLDSQDKSKYKITIEDTGIGMSNEFIKRIFIPFERETRFREKNIVGTGLGMPIVYNTVQQMGGNIHIESELGKGSKFTVTIPLDILKDTDNTTDVSKDDTDILDVNLTGKNILVAEDNELNMEIVTEVLKMHNINVTQAWNGREAFEIFKNSELNSFDAILMDLQMPELNGCESCRLIRALERTDAKIIPIIALTANAFTDDIAATVNAGMNAHISKPINFDDLENVLKRYLK